jgi:hypothetical protein
MQLLPLDGAAQFGIAALACLDAPHWKQSAIQSCFSKVKFFMPSQIDPTPWNLSPQCIIVFCGELYILPVFR